MKRTPFKLRSGNTTPFKQMAEEKETMEQYNARVMADYESKLQSNTDSTAAHTNRLEAESFGREYEDLGSANFNFNTISGNFDDSGDDKNRMLSSDEELARGKTHDYSGKEIIAGSDTKYYHPKNRLTKEQVAENEKIKASNEVLNTEQSKLGGKIMKSRYKNRRAGIHEATGEGEYKGSLKPGPPPAKPNVGKLHHSKYYDPKTKEYRVTSYNPKKLKSGKYSSTGRGKKISDMSEAEWKSKYNKD
tara:strand:+ start:13 stop:753 length:741 start_codon:yes stop_codon:yes gene_type:complete